MSFGGAIAGHLPALQVVVPLLAAPACSLVTRPRAGWIFALAISWICFAIAIALSVQVIGSGPVSYELGGWAAPWGIEYRVDALNAFVLLIVAGASAMTLAFAHRTVVREVRADRIYLFYTAWLLALTGLLGITITGDAFNVFVFLEIASLSSYLLVSLGGQRRALLAAFRYLVMGTVGATFFLIGLGLMYLSTGTLNMLDLAARLPDLAGDRAIVAALVFVVVGIGLKAAVFPFHAWLPDAYARAPSAASIFLAGTATKVAVYVLIRFLFTIFGVSAGFSAAAFGSVLLALGLAGALVGSLVALHQNEAKRLLAWSSIAQVGYMTVGISLASVTGLTAAIVHLFNHALIKVALFMAIANVVYRIGSDDLSRLAGLGHRMPWTGAALLVCGASLVGIPLTAGFVSKWYLLAGILESGQWAVAVVILITSLIALLYVVRILLILYFEEAMPGTIQAKAKEAPLPMLVVLWVVTGANVYFGIDTSVTVGMAEIAAVALVGGAP